MRARRRLLWTMAALVVPCGALAAVGVRALADDLERAETRYRAQAETALGAAKAALDAAVRRLADGFENSVTLRADRDGTLREPAGPTAASRPTTRPEAEEGAALVELFERETARLRRTSGDAAAAARLREIVERADVAATPEVRPWALIALAAVERAAGRTAEARAAWERVVVEHAEARDARGVRRAHVARLLMSETDDTPDIAALLALYDDLARDAGPAPSAAAALLLDRVAEAARAAAGSAAAPEVRARLETVAAAERRRARSLRLVDAWERGGAAWAAGGAEGGARSFAPEDGPPFVVSVRRTADGFAGAALEADALAARALRAPDVAPFAAVGLLAEVGPAPRTPDELAATTLGAPWPEGWRLTVAGADLAGFRAAERRKFTVGAALAGLALLVAAFAAWATVRAVDRELRAARDREGFVAATTHELKTPLAAIKLFAELMPDPELDPAKRAEFAGRIGAEADRLARLVGAVLDFARLERSSPAELRARFVACDLGERLRGVVETFRPVAAAQGFDVGWSAPDAGLRVLGDPDALGGALLNLLDNAVKYGGTPHRIDVSVRAEAGDRVAFAVADRGPGVPAAERRRVFEPFVRIGDEMTREKKGVGLGLALVLRVAEAHGGAARVEARDGGGSVFVVELPAARPTYDAAARSPSA